MTVFKKIRSMFNKPAEKLIEVVEVRSVHETGRAYRDVSKAIGQEYGTNSIYAAKVTKGKPKVVKSDRPADIKPDEIVTPEDFERYVEQTRRDAEILQAMEAQFDSPAE